MIRKIKERIVTDDKWGSRIMNAYRVEIFFKFLNELGVSKMRHFCCRFAISAGIDSIGFRKRIIEKLYKYV